MKNIKYKVIDPDGGVHERSSKRTYTHAVLYRESRSARLAKIEAERESYAKLNAKNYRFYQQNADHPAYSALLSVFPTEESYLKGQHDKLVGFANEASYGWKVAGYCGRKDLADKLAQKTRGYPAVKNAVVVEVQTANGPKSAGNKPEPCEFYEAQSIHRDSKSWGGLGVGKTLERAKEIIQITRNGRGPIDELIGSSDDEYTYRIRHFVGTVETIEIN